MGLFSKQKLMQRLQQHQQEKSNTILLVDDEPDNLTTLCDFLQRDFEIETAADGQKALELIQQGDCKRFCLIISDQRMPVMSGVDFLEKTLELCPSTKRILLTGFADASAALDAISRARIHEYIHKPYEPDTMRLTVKRVVEAWSLESKNKQLAAEIRDHNIKLERTVVKRSDQLMARNQELEILNQIVAAINVELDLETVSKTLVNQISLLFPQVLCRALIIFDPSQNTSVPLAVSGLVPQGMPQTPSQWVALLHAGGCVAEGIFHLEADGLPCEPIPENPIILTIKDQDRDSGLLLLDLPDWQEELGKLTRLREHLTSAYRNTKLHYNLIVRRNFLRDTFGRYLSTEVVSSLLAKGDGPVLGGERRDITIVFAEIKQYSELARSLDPSNLLETINRYLALMVAVIGEHEGTIVEIQGDVILIIFGAPLNLADHPSQALACALKMRSALLSLNHELEAVQIKPLHMGVGIHSGEAVVGNIGSPERMKYGVVGGKVNLTARIMSYARQDQILISLDTFSRIPHSLLIGEQRDVLPKGVQEPIRVFEVKEMLQKDQ